MGKPTNAWQTVVLRVNYDPTSGLSEPAAWNWTEVLGEEVQVEAYGAVCLPNVAEGGRDLLVKAGDLEYMSEDDYICYLADRNDQLKAYDEAVKRYLENAERRGKADLIFPDFPYAYKDSFGNRFVPTEKPNG
jgi:hypothetical protein